jgi:hypothetical protein
MEDRTNTGWQVEHDLSYDIYLVVDEQDEVVFRSVWEWLAQAVADTHQLPVFGHA